MFESEGVGVVSRLAIEATDVSPTVGVYTGPGLVGGGQNDVADRGNDQKRSIRYSFKNQTNMRDFSCKSNKYNVGGQH